MEKQYKYDAFISYRHLSPDKPIAIKLQKLLETYTPPKGAIGQESQAGQESQEGQPGTKNQADQTGQLSHRKLHLFRDESELPTSNDLGADIQSALEQSRFLVVICSPQFEKSKWCIQEVTYFKALHGGSNRNILPLLVDDPDHSPVFPDVLRYETRQVTQPDGTVQEIQNEIEPLAANVSAKSLSQMLKRLKTEYLRIAAPLFGCGFDDLYRRDQRRRNRRRAALFGSVTAILGTAAVLSTSALVTISSQKRQIEADAAELLLNNQELWMRESKMLEKDGDLYGALEAVSQAFPADSEPLSGVIGQSVSLLGSYEPDTFTAIRKIRLSATPTDICILNDGKTLAARSASGLSLWNTETAEMICDYGLVSDAAFSRDPQIDKASVYYYARGSSVVKTIGNVLVYPVYHKTIREETPLNGGNAVFAVGTDMAVRRFSPVDGSVLWSVQLDSYATFPIEQLAPGYLLPIRTYDHLLLLDPSDGTEKASYELDALEEMLGYDYFKVYAANGYLIFTVSANDSTTCVVCRPTQQMPEEIFRRNIFGTDDLGDAVYSIYEDTLCVVGYAFTGILDEATTYFRGYSLTDGSLLWSAEAPTILSGHPFAGVISPDDGSLNPYPVAFGVVGDRLFTANAKTGKLFFDQQLPGTAVNVYYSANGYVFVTDQGGLEYFFALRRFDNDNTERILSEDREYQTGFQTAAYGNNLYAIVRGSDTEILLYRVLANDARRTLFQTAKDDDWAIGEIILNQDKTLAVVTQSDPYRLTVLDPETGKVQQTFRYGDWPDVSFFDNSRLLVRVGDSLQIANITTGETEQEFSNDDYFMFSYFQGDGFLIIQRKEDDVWIKVTANLPPAKIALAEPDQKYTSTNILSASPSGNILLLKTADYSKDNIGYDLRFQNLENGEIIDCGNLPLTAPGPYANVYLWQETDQELYMLWDGLIIGYSCKDGSIVCESENPEAVDLILVDGELCILDKAGYLIRMKTEGTTLTEVLRRQVTTNNPSQGMVYEPGQDGIGYLYRRNNSTCIVINPATFEVLYEISHFCGLSKDCGTVYIQYYDCFDAYPVPDAAELRKQLDARLK